MVCWLRLIHVLGSSSSCIDTTLLTYYTQANNCLNTYMNGIVLSAQRERERERERENNNKKRL
jgi:hypothetical protein